MSKSPPPIFDVLPLNTLFNSFVSALEAVNLITGVQAIFKKSHLSHFEEGDADFIEGLDADAISTEDKLSGLQIALTKKKSPNDSFDKIIRKLSTCDDLIIRVCEDANLEYFNALTDNGNRKLTPDQISKIINHKDSNERSIFNRDFAVNNLDFFKSMVQAGLEKSLKAGDKNGRTALHEACAKDDLYYAKALIQAGGEELLKVKDNDGRTALHYACIKGNLDLTKALIQAGGKDLLNAKDENENTALHYACIKGNFLIAKELIEAGGEELLNAQDKNGRTALHEACAKEELNFAKALIEAGGKDLFNTKDKDGRTALH